MSTQIDVKKQRIVDTLKELARLVEVDGQPERVARMLTYLDGSLEDVLYEAEDRLKVLPRTRVLV